MADSDLTDEERYLALTADKLAEMVNSRSSESPDDAMWAEELIPPLYGEDDPRCDVLSSALRTQAGDENPKTGFTLWDGDQAISVTLEIMPRP